MKRQGESGFSLMEVLVAILVLSGGVIGSAGMQLVTMRTTQQSSFHNIALQLAAEMADRMRANESSMKQADSENPFLSLDYDAAVDGEPSAPGVSCYEQSCSEQQLAEFAIYEWQKRIKALLPGGRAVICRDVSPWDDASKSFAWTCKPGAGNDASLVIKLGWQGKNPDGSLLKNEDDQFAPSVALTVAPYIQ